MKGVLVFLIFGPVGWLFYYFFFVRRRGGRLPGGLSGAGSIEHGRDFPVAPLLFDVNYLCRSRRLFLPVHLLLLTPLLSDTCPVAGDVEFQDDRVMHEAVYGRGSSHGVGEYVLPLGEDQVRGDT